MLEGPSREVLTRGELFVLAGQAWCVPGSQSIYKKQIYEKNKVSPAIPAAGKKERKDTTSIHYLEEGALVGIGGSSGAVLRPD